MNVTIDIETARTLLRFAHDRESAASLHEAENRRDGYPVATQIHADIRHEAKRMAALLNEAIKDAQPAERDAYADAADWDRAELAFYNENAY